MVLSLEGASRGSLGVRGLRLGAIGSQIARHESGGVGYLPITLAGIACIIMHEVYATIRGEHISEPKQPE